MSVPDSMRLFPRGARARLWASLAAVILLTITARAGAEVGAPAGTIQQSAADALFLQYAPPPPQPGVVCLVDSGVDLNPDTTPALAGSYALQSGADTADELAKMNPPVDGHPNGHGTYMAMVMSAPQNGWGMVGIAPTSVRVYNIKALSSGQTTFPFDYYDQAIYYCKTHAAAVNGVLDVINLSLGSGTSPTSSELATLQNDVAAARTYSRMNVVAAAGNSGGAVDYPAAVSGVFAVGGSDANPANLGVMCSFSNRGPQLQVLAPGCGSQTESGGGGGLDMAFEDDGSPAWGQGTSEASAEVSAAIASMRVYGPSIGVSQAEQCITSTEVRRGNMDVAQAFRACGLGSVVDQGNAAYQAANTPAPTTALSNPHVPTSTTSPTASTPVLLPLPRLGRVRFERHTLSVQALNLPSGARMRVIVQKRAGKRFVTVASRTFATARAHLRVAGWDRVVVRFIEANGQIAPSRDATITRFRRSARGATVLGVRP